MIELGAAALAFGAVLYRNLAFELFSVSLVAVSMLFFGVFLFRSLRGIAFSLLLSIAVVFGAVAVQGSEREAPRALFGDRAFLATVSAVDRRLARSSLVVRDTAHGAKLQLFLSHRTMLLPGDTISVRARVEQPEAFLTDSGRLFDYPGYLKSKGIDAVAQNAQVLLQEKGTPSLSRIAALIRFRVADILAQFVSFPVDGMIAGMTVGYQGALPEYIQDLFRTTGVLHVLVLSGYNITLLAGFLGLLLRRLPFRLRTMLTIAAIILLVVVSGSGVASVRAGIMGTIALFAGLALRSYHPLRALVLAFLFFFFLSPQAIFSDPGFHLSFLATAFMVLALPKAQQLFSFLPETAGINLRELCMLAVSIPLFMLPYTMYFSGSFPLVAPLANIILAIFTPLLMLLGIAVIALSWVPMLADIFGALASAAGTIVVRALEVCAQLPQWNTPQLPWWLVALFYTLFLVLLLRGELTRYFWQLRNSLLPASNPSG